MQEKALLLTGILFLGPFLFTSLVLHIMAAHSEVTGTLPLGTIFAIALLYILVSVPVLFLERVFGHRYSSNSQSSPVTKKNPREIPPLPFYRKTLAQMFIAGLLPFSAIALELHHFYATIWGYKVYSTSGTLLFSFLVLLLITVMLSVGLTYFQLTVEDHKWWWRYVPLPRSSSFLQFIPRKAIIHHPKVNYYEFQVYNAWRLDSHLHVLLLYILLHEIKHERLPAGSLLLRLQRLHLLRVLPDARGRKLSSIVPLRPPHIPRDQERVNFTPLVPASLCMLQCR